MNAKYNLTIGKTTRELNLPKLIMPLGQYWYQYLHTKHWNHSSIISHLDPTGLYSQSCLCGKWMIPKCHTLLAMTQKCGEHFALFLLYFPICPWPTGAVASSLVKQKLQEVILKKQKQAALERTNSNSLSTPPVSYRWHKHLLVL